ncbi:MAG: bifunctional alpha,alpha-trehalose-phosphate synthase (UDP-forming)/trehalose-phosphatase [Candidatus Caenarcaniphilales bacterium]|nr:bifunctional alpha,alpha-trehalose-phosphate synthase (UDP-forming)/trehalose-phosphatase [Candidatus Caenarcaniphilales bacterium]
MVSLTNNDKRIIVVANRLPVNISIKDDKPVYSPSPGGLVTALSSLKDSYKQEWLGWPGEVDLDIANANEIKEKLNNDFNSHPVFLTKQQVNRYYFGFSNKVLWPIMHYLPSHCDYDERDWKAYKKVNELFAENLLKEIKPSENDLIWIHDYQLMLLPALVREKLPNANIGFFLHTPFPSAEVFRAVPYRDELLKGVLGSSLIGFHTFGYLRHFRSALLRILGLNSEIYSADLENHTVKLGVYPISTDTNQIQELAHSTKIEQNLKQVKQIKRGRKLIISVDRLDYTKGISRRLKGFKKLLDRNPKYASELCMVQIAVPSRTKIASYRRLKDEVEDLVVDINEKYENEKEPPVIYMYKSVSFEKLVSFYKQADIALVTPLCDGMNLVAKEYVAVQKDKGVLILSEFAGAAAELGESVTVNPWNPDAIADALEHALGMMPWEKSRRMSAMFTKVKRNDVHYWSKSFLMDLSKTSEKDQHSNGETIPVNSQISDEILEKYKKAKSPLLLLDYDGTLVNFTSVPMNAKPDKNLLNSLEEINNCNGTEVSIVTGRAKGDIVEWFGDLNFNFSTEHGLWIKMAGEQNWHKTLPDDQHPNWYEEVKEIYSQFCRATPGSFIEEKETSIAWHYRLTDPEFGTLQARELVVNLTNFLANKPAEVMQGKSIVEVRVPGINKGSIISRIQQLDKEYDFMLAIGDDFTDEDLFSAVPEDAVTIKVGKGSSKAKYRLNKVSDVRNFLHKIQAAKS